MDFFEGWFKCFDSGLQSLSDEECERLLAPCGAECAKYVMEYLYRPLFEVCGRDLDTFFSRLNEVNGVDGAVVVPGKVYDIMFLSCGCDLHTRAHVDSAKLCLCSRQSIITEMKELAPGRDFTVEMMSSVLRGDERCRFRITLL